MSVAVAPFVLHIGMPKTATTSLQASAFPHIAKTAGYAYPGLRQPLKELQQAPVISNLHRFFLHGSHEQELREQLQALLAEGPLLISHESILASSVEADWHTRSGRVADMCRPHSPQVYITVRHPLDAMHSYYVEHYLTSPSGKSMSFGKAVASDVRLQIYRYARSIPEIGKRFGCRPMVEPFEDVVAGRSAFLKALSGQEDYLGGSLSRHNVKDREGGTTFLRSVTLKDRLRLFLYSTPIGNSLAARKLVARIASPFGFLDRIGSSAIEIPPLSPEQRAAFLVELEPDIAYLRDEFGIDYGDASGNR